MINLGYSRTVQVVGHHVPQNQNFQRMGKIHCLNNIF